MSKKTNKTIRTIFSCLLLVVVSGLVTFGREQSPIIYAEQTLDSDSMLNTTLVELRADTLPNAPKYLRTPQSRRAPQTANFNINYNPVTCEYPVTAWPNDAVIAFESAIDIWGAILNSSQTIEVDACWSTLGTNILGSAGATTYYRNFSNAPVANTWYPIAIANGIAGTDLNPSISDIVANFNSSYPNWYFGTDGNPPNNEYDFTTVILHEVGHGLGFSGSMFVNSGSGLGSWGLGSGFPFSYDRFTENGSNQALINTAVFPNNSAALATQLTSGDVFFDGPEASTANGNSPVELYTPSTWSQGSSYSHLGESFNGTNEALMTYSLSQGEVQHNPGPIIRALLNDIGWNATSGSATATPTATATNTATPIPSNTPTETATATPVPSNTPTLTPVATATNTVTVTPIPSNTPTQTATPNQTATTSATSTLTQTPIASETSTLTPTLTPINTPVATDESPTITPSVTQTAVLSLTPEMTQTVIPSLTPEMTQTVIPSLTPEMTQTAIPTVEGEPNPPQLTILFYLPITTR
ncbi:MAG: hypothetical protein AB8G95_05120 [Anaerolineae bacterium]